VPREEDAVAGDNFARFQQGDVAYHNFLEKDEVINNVQMNKFFASNLDIDDLFNAITDDFQTTFLFLVVQ